MVTADHRPGLIGYIQPEGTSAWVDDDDGEWLTTTSPAPGMVVVEWFSPAEPGMSSEYLWEHGNMLDHI